MKTVRNLDLSLVKRVVETETEKRKKLPHIGEKVRIEILEVDELEVKCWLQDYSMLGFIDNTSLTYSLTDKGRFYSFMQVCSTYEGVIWIKNPRSFIVDDGLGGIKTHNYIELL